MLMYGCRNMSGQCARNETAQLCALHLRLVQYYRTVALVAVVAFDMLLVNVDPGGRH